MERECVRRGAARLARLRSPIFSLPRGPLPSRETVPVRALYRFSASTHLQASLPWVPTKKRLRLSSQPFLCLAERTRFELAVELPLRQFSKLLVSATHPPLRKLAEKLFSIASAKVLLFLIPARILPDFFRKNAFGVVRWAFFLGFRGAYCKFLYLCNPFTAGRVCPRPSIKRIESWQILLLRA